MENLTKQRTRGQRWCQFCAEVVHAFVPRVGRISLVNTALRGFQSLYGTDKITITPVTHALFYLFSFEFKISKI